MPVQKVIRAVRRVIQPHCREDRCDPVHPKTRSSPQARSVEACIERHSRNSSHSLSTPRGPAKTPHDAAADCCCRIVDLVDGLHAGLLHCKIDKRHVVVCIQRQDATRVVQVVFSRRSRSAVRRSGALRATAFATPGEAAVARSPSGTPKCVQPVALTRRASSGITQDRRPRCQACRRWQAIDRIRRAPSSGAQPNSRRSAGRAMKVPMRTVPTADGAPRQGCPSRSFTFIEESPEVRVRNCQPADRF